MLAPRPMDQETLDQWNQLTVHDDITGEKVYKASIARMINDGINISVNSTDRTKRVMCQPRYSSLQGKSGSTIEQSFRFGVSMADVVDDTGTDLMKEGDYGVMIVEAKMNSQNKKSSRYLAVVMFTNFGANNPALAQAYDSWPVGKIAECLSWC